MFSKGDVDKSQLIERREFHLALSTLGVDASTAAADLTFDFFDEDHNGSIDYRELVSTMGEQIIHTTLP